MNKDIPDCFSVTRRRQLFIAAGAGLLLGLFFSGCATPAQTAGLAIAGTTFVGAQTPGDEIEQIYYLGVFDPTEQLPPTVYRVTVRGQASILSGTQFASGWVPARLIDSLSSQNNGENNGTRFSQPEGVTDQSVDLKTGRRLMMFGPEGFREAPKDHRLVIVMGANPDAYFEAIDLAVSGMSGATVERGTQASLERLTDSYLAATRQDRRLEDFLTETRKTLAPASP